MVIISLLRQVRSDPSKKFLMFPISIFMDGLVTDVVVSAGGPRRSGLIYLSKLEKLHSLYTRNPKLLLDVM